MKYRRARGVTASTCFVSLATLILLNLSPAFSAKPQGSCTSSHIAAALTIAERFPADVHDSSQLIQVIAPTTCAGWVNWHVSTSISPPSQNVFCSSSPTGQTMPACSASGSGGFFVLNDCRSGRLSGSSNDQSNVVMTFSSASVTFYVHVALCEDKNSGADVLATNTLGSFTANRLGRITITNETSLMSNVVRGADQVSLRIAYQDAATIEKYSISLESTGVTAASYDTNQNRFQARRVQLWRSILRFCSTPGPAPIVFLADASHASSGAPVTLDLQTPLMSSDNSGANSDLLASTPLYLHLVVDPNSPSEVTSGEAWQPPIRVHVKDYYNQTSATENTALVSATSSATLSTRGASVLPTKAIDGLVTFEGLGVLASPGTSVTLFFESPRFASRTSVTLKIRQCREGEFIASQRCELCPQGWTSNQTNAEKCNPCQQGEFAASAGESTCSKCTPGTFSPSEGALACTECEAGRYSSQLGASSCSACSSGTFSTSGSSMCHHCGSGRFSAAGAPCTDCPRGWFSQALAAEVCSRCDLGQFSNQLAAEKCEDCPAGKYGVTAANQLRECALCGAGRFSSARADLCSECAPGRSSSIGAEICDPCAKGRFSNAASSECALCPAGFASSLEGAGFCVACAAGRFSPGPGNPSCNACERGRFAPSAGTYICKTCGAGTIAPQNGSSSCERTPAGFIASEDRRDLVPCPVGKYSSVLAAPFCQPARAGFHVPHSNSTFQSLCPPGSYNELPAQARCISCPAGWYSSSAGQMACSRAPTGTAVSRSGEVAASRCQPGRYSPGTNTSYSAVACVACDRGSYSLAAAASCTVCDRGQYAEAKGSSTCDRCPVGYSAKLRSHNCTACKAGQHSSLEGSSECISCELGEYADAPASAACLKCAAGTFAAKPGQQRCTMCEPGTHSDVSGMSQCRPCQVNTFARLSGSTSCSACPDGSWTKDQLARDECEPCQLGEVFPPNASGSCIRCEAESYSLVPGERISKACHNCPDGAYCAGGHAIAPRVGFWRAGPAGVRMNKCRLPHACLGVRWPEPDHPLNQHVDENTTERCRSGYFGVTCGNCQPGYAFVGRHCEECGPAAAEMALALGRLSAIALLLYWFVWRTRRSSLSVKSSPLATIVKITVSHMQLLSLALAYPVDWPDMLTQVFNILEVLSYLDALVPLGCAFQGRTMYQSTALFLTIPVIYCMVFFCVDLIMHLISWRNCNFKKSDLHRKTLQILLITNMILYPTVVKKTFQLFACQSIVLLDESGQEFAQYRLIANPDLVCYDAAHTAAVLAIGVPGLLVFALGVPLLILVLLICNRKNIMHPRYSDVPAETRNMIGFIIKAFEPDYFYWEMVRVLRKTALIATTVFLHTLSARLKIFMGTLCSAVAAATHLRNRPFRSSLLDLLEEMTLLCLTGTLFVGILFVGDDSLSGAAGIVAAFAIVVSNGTVLAYLVYCIWASVRRWQVFVRLGEKLRPICKCMRGRKQAPAASKLKLGDRLKAHVQQMVNEKKTKKVFSLLGVAMTPDLIQPTCSHCGRSPKNRQMKVCASCRTSMYCSVTCQRKDFKHHKHVCGGTQSPSVASPPKSRTKVLPESEGAVVGKPVAGDGASERKELLMSQWLF